MDKYRPFAILVFCFCLNVFEISAVEQFLSVAVEQGYTPKDDGIEIIEGSMSHISSALSSSLTIHTLNFNQSLTNIYMISALEVDTFTGTMYFAETKSKSIYRFKLDLSFTNKEPQPEKLFTGLSNHLFGMAFDWVTKNVYWADANHGTITVKPANTVDPMMSVTVLSGLYSPEGLTIDPLSGYMFWFSRRPSRIERSKMTGEERHTMTSDVGFVADMAVDVREQRLYWIDSIRYNLVVSDYFSRDVRVLYRSYTGAIYTSITVTETDVCVVAYTSYRLTCLKKTTGATSFSRSYYFANNLPFTLAYYAQNMQKTDQSDACKNHNCDHICLIRSSTEGKCACKDGFTLKTDGRTCEAVDELYNQGILLTNGSHICMAESRAASGSTMSLKCIQDEIGNATHLAAHAKEKTVFFYDTYRKSIRSHNVQTRTFADLLINRDNVTDMTFDYKTKDIYWIEDSAIGVLQVTTKQYKIPLHDPVVFKTNAFSITCAPLKKLLIWLDYGTSGKAQIYAGTMDGGFVSVFIPSQKLTAVTTLEYDEYAERVFWVDNGVLYGRALNATISSIYRLSQKLTMVNNILLYKLFVIWIDSTMKANAEGYLGNSMVSLTDDSFGNVSGMCLFDTSVEMYEEGPCDINNGGCEQICLPHYSEAVCTCMAGLELDETDKKSCVSKPLDTNFFLAADSTNGYIYQISSDGKKFVTLKLPKSVGVTAAEYSKMDNVLYVLDYKNSKLWSVMANGQNLTEVKQLGGQPTRLTMDYTSGYVYYCASSGSDSYVAVIDPKMKIEKTLITGLTAAYGVAVYPEEGLMFVAADGIIRSNMDGSEQKTIVSFFYFIIDGISVDYKEKRIYWVDWFYETVETATFNGDDRKELGTHQRGYLTDVAVWGDSLYYSGDNLHNIVKMDKKTGHIFSSWMPHQLAIQRIQTVVAVPGEIQPASTACKNNGGCSSFCLPSTNSGKTCACEDGDVLLDDKKSCANAKKTCPRTIANGQIITTSPTCFNIEGYTCKYECDRGYRQNMTINTNKITCTSTGQWDHPVNFLCEAIKCPKVIPFGTVDGTCDFMGNSHCSYKCQDGYLPSQNLVSCTSSGYWNTDVNKLCQKAVTCTEPVKHGMLLQPCKNYGDSKCTVRCNTNSNFNTAIRSVHCRSTGELSANPDSICVPVQCSVNGFSTLTISGNCNPTPGTACTYTCKDGYISASGRTDSSVACLSSGVWSKTEQDMCKPVPCTEAVPDTTIQNGVQPVAFKSYKFTCTDQNKNVKHPDIYAITCLPDGTWSTRVDNLCQAPSPASSAGLSVSESVGITVGAFLIAIIVVLFIVYVVINRRKSHKARFNGPEVRYSPNEFSNPAVDIQPSPDSMYDNIQVKQASSSEEMKPSSEIGNPYTKF